MVAHSFPCYHPRKGKPTNFKDLILEGIKEHTCRADTEKTNAYEYWRDAACEINTGKAVLVLKQWAGRPYYTTPVEFMRITHIEVQPLFMTYDWTCHASVNLDYVYVNELCINDGLEFEDFVWWFFPKKVDEWKGCVIHFKPQRYENGKLVKIEKNEQ